MVAVLAPVVAVMGQTCSWTSQGTTYNLAPMTSTTTYSVRDVRNPTTRYFFNFCTLTSTPTTSPPNQCTVYNRPNNANPALAWQVENVDDNDPNDECYRLGGTLSTGWNFTLFDPMYPDRGVQLSYGQGDGIWCPNGLARSLNIAVICALVAPNPSSYGLVTAYESTTCGYSVQLPSLAGCPTQCLTGGGSTLCNSHGVCGYNVDVGRSQCYCYNGYTGALCSDTVATPSGITVEGVLLVIVCLALAGVLGLVAYMVLRLRKLNVNPAAYGQLEGRFNELGQMA